MGVEEIVAIIEREADEEATRILEDAERQARETVAAAEAGVQARVDAAVGRLGPEIRAAAQRRINAVRLRILEDRARADAARLVGVVDTAEDEVRAIAGGADPPRWSSALSAWCTEALRAVGQGATVRLRAGDVGAVRGVADRWRAEVVALADDEEPGVLVSAQDGRLEVDARLSVRLERARKLLAESVAQVLRLGAVEDQPGAVG
jgi:vacuolar-type H+-ATPase subunit E/Vma4